MLITELPGDSAPTAQTRSWLSHGHLPTVVPRDLILMAMRVMGLSLHEGTGRRGSETVWRYVLQGNSRSLIWYRRRLTCVKQCARCRKRKIKCTGDLLDGNGCEACQAAGVPRSSCHYLRVNSHHLEDVALQASSESEWPYSAPAPGNYMARITTDPSQYALANVSHVPQQVPNPYAGPG